VIELAFRRGGETVYVDETHPGGISLVEFERLSPSEQRRGWREMVRDPELYAKVPSATPTTTRSCCRTGIACS
jgi:hypothetical protein